MRCGQLRRWARREETLRLLSAEVTHGGIELQESNLYGSDKGNDEMQVNSLMVGNAFYSRDGLLQHKKSLEIFPRKRCQRIQLSLISNTRIKDRGASINPVVGNYGPKNVGRLKDIERKLRGED